MSEPEGEKPRKMNSPSLCSNGGKIARNFGASTNDVSTSKSMNGNAVPIATNKKNGDIRNFLKTFSPGTKRQHPDEDEELPQPKRLNLQNGDSVGAKKNHDAGTTNESSVVNGLHQDEEPEVVILKESVGHIDTSIQATSKTVVSEQLIKPALKHPKHPNCTDKEVKIVVPKLEQTVFFTEAVKKQLEEWKEWRTWEGKDYEVESILDYAWCKLKVRDSTISRKWQLAVLKLQMTVNIYGSLILGY